MGSTSPFNDDELQTAYKQLIQNETPEMTKHMRSSELELSMLQKITAKRVLDYEQMDKSSSSSSSVAHLVERMHDLETRLGPRLNLLQVIRSQSPCMALAAEFKRASPSKGDIATHLVAGEQAVKYYTSGASIISVLTEQHWFKGSLSDLTQVREMTQMVAQQQQQTTRPAILRKDFVINTYMILEAAAAGADTVLLIVAITPSNVLKQLIDFCRSIDMEPLVEVHAEEELDVAIKAGAKVIGVNNRNLHTFQLDLATTDRAADQLRQRELNFTPNDNNYDDYDDTNTECYALCALSGMSNAEDVQRYRRIGVGMCLIGESLMRSPDPNAAIASLCLNPLDYSDNTMNKISSCSAAYTSGTKIVKVCGVTNAEDALTACQSGASLIGIIFVPSSKRYVSPESAKFIVDAVQNFGERNGRIEIPYTATNYSSSPVDAFIQKSRALEHACRRPLVVGVFQNPPDLNDLKTLVLDIGLDLVQLHGEEGMEACSKCGVPVIRVVHITTTTTADEQQFFAERLVASLTADPIAILLDTSVKGVKGGTGVTFDWTIAQSVQNLGLPIIVAGGLTAGNVDELVLTVRPWGVDVSSGVEESPVKKDSSKVLAFVSNAKKAAEEASKSF